MCAGERNKPQEVALALQLEGVWPGMGIAAKQRSLLWPSAARRGAGLGPPGSPRPLSSGMGGLGRSPRA